MRNDAKGSPPKEATSLRPFMEKVVVRLPSSMVEENHLVTAFGWETRFKEMSSPALQFRRKLAGL